VCRKPAVTVTTNTFFGAADAVSGIGHKAAAAPSVIARIFFIGFIRSLVVVGLWMLGMGKSISKLLGRG